MAKGFFIGVDGVAKKVKQGFIGVGGFTPRNLPSGYTQVEYIESSGTQYVDTGFKMNQDTRVVMRVRPTSITANAWAFEGRTSNSNASKGVFFFYSSTKLWSADYNGYDVRQGFSGISATDLLEIDYDKNICTINGVSKIFEAETFQSTTNLVLLALNTNGTISGELSARLYSCQIYDNGNLIRDYVACTNNSGTAGLYDLVDNVFYANAGTGTFTVGGSDPNAAIARRIKEAFIGIGGVARPCWSGGELKYYGVITSLGEARKNLAATSIGDYALFGGGYGDSGNSATVDSYNASLTHSTSTNLSTARYDLTAATVGEYALFGGGHSLSGSHYYHSTVDAYNTSLTHSTPTALGEERGYLAATTVGNYALFGGGMGNNDASSTVDAYNKSLTHSTPTVLSVGRIYLSATTVGNYALFGGGCYRYGGSNNYSTVDAYNASLTRSIPTVLNEARYRLAATTVGNYALFGGGYNASDNSAIVDAYNASLTHSIPAILSEGRCYLASTTVGNYALFGGGSNWFAGGAYTSTVDVYDDSLTHSTSDSLSEIRYSLEAATVGDYALFGGGDRGNGDSEDHSSTVDVYTIA